MARKHGKGGLDRVRLNPITESGKAGRPQARRTRVCPATKGVPTMSASCWIVYADRVVTRMTVWSPRVDDLDIGRALYLAHCAYESRMRRPHAGVGVENGTRGR